MKVYGQMEELERLNEINKKIIDLSFKSLYEKAISEWPLWIYSDQAYDMASDLHAKYYGQNIELIMAELHSSIFRFIPSSTPVNKFYLKDLDSSIIKDDFADSLKYHISSCKEENQGEHDWNAQEIALSKAYLEVNK